MSGAFIPVWIIGGPFIGLLILSLMYRGGSSSGSRMDLPPHVESRDRCAEVGAIAELSGRVSPGAISEFSHPVAPGTISRLSGRVAPGAISTLSRRVSPGAISELSRPRPVGNISRLSAGWFASGIFGLPLLTRAQASLEPDETLLISDR